ncbi:restriction endonuclease PLD domain-containing protein [Photobacterium lucens]|uniref:restriction endonuclease PLD domain-containing protein n=1 Tax=Photobacterium lucens TaxID=2562949 RepID=UPI00136D07BE|nr:restriction endonuclease PLD domain-containing protein [Photobacterium lucens]MZG55064.1 NgoFVII family restriction endonuclease [Photobacterium lucens]
MKIISKPSDIDKTLVKLMKRYSKYYIATAWASMGSKASSELAANQDRIAQMVVGTHFFQTHPNFIEKFMDSENVRFILKSDGIYHPKVYLFTNNEREWECLVGSANFTLSALKRNHEVVIHFGSDDRGAESSLKDLLNTIDMYWLESKTMNSYELDNYRNIWEKNKTKLSSLGGRYGGQQSKDSIVKSEVFSLKWEDYYRKVSADSLGSFSGRLDVLRLVNEYFTEHHSFNKFTELQRKQVAGITTDSKVNWKWFGSMVGAGKFKNRINTNNEFISEALEQIPLTGPVGEEDYKRFVDWFKLAFPDGGAGLATASRLLAMKRPDYFVCLDSQNRSELCKDFGIPENVKFDTYWTNIIARILDSVWWSAPRPTDTKERQAWEGRVAMIDAIFYEGSA